jgi:ribonuclease HI
MSEEGSNLKLMWVPAQVGIKGNETVDKAAKEALNPGGGQYLYGDEVRME